VDSTVQQHVRDYLCDFVAVKPRRVTLSWYSFAGGRERADCLWRLPLYVDPVTACCAALTACPR
jgi:hypothetical protein